MKFFLHMGKAAQKERFLERIDDPEKNWKFAAGDVAESRHWDRYMEAYEQALNATSRPEAPWYAIPADDKEFMRATVADIVCKTIEDLPLAWPEPSEKDRAEMLALRSEIAAGLGVK
ncbi:MAG: hypothetical protein KC731_01675, partial [Myxococcales bacterium]|nr:hypothetical protein [Myxococcales bacterium]